MSSAVPAQAKALEVDPARLFQLALQQWAAASEARAFDQIFDTIVAQNEKVWLEEIRNALGHSDPALTTRTRVALRTIFGTFTHVR